MVFSAPYLIIVPCSGNSDVDSLVLLLKSVFLSAARCVFAKVLNVQANHSIRQERYLKRGSMDLKQQLTKLTFALIVLCLLVSACTLVSSVNAQERNISANPNKGPPGTAIYVIGMGFRSGIRVDITLESAHTWTSAGYGLGNRFSIYLNVPNLSPGTYTVTATDEEGNSATTTFTVTQKTTTTPTPSGYKPTSKPSSPSGTNDPENPEETPFDYNPYNPNKPTPTPVEADAGFWSAPVIGLTVAFIVVASLLVVFFVRRGGGKREPLISDEQPLYRQPPGPTTQPGYYSGSSPSRYNQSPYYGPQFSKPPTSTSRYGQSPYYGQQPARSMSRPYPGSTSSYRQSAGHTKLCPSCKRVIKDDYNRCPFCDKRLK